MRRNRHHSYRRRRRGFGEAIAYAFRERQIYLRSEGEVEFITLRPWVQVTGLVCLLVGLFWLAFSSINVAFKDQLLALRERGMYDARLEYEDRIAELRKEIDRLNDRLMIDQGEYLGKVDAVRTQYQTLVEQHKRLVDFFKQGVARKERGGTAPAVNEDDIPEAPANGEPADSNDSSSTDAAPGGAAAGVKFADIYRAEFQTKAESERPLNDLRDMFAGYERMKMSLLDEAIAIADGHVKKAGGIFASLGIDAKRVVAKSEYVPADVGGPFIAAAARIDGDAGSAVGKRMEQVFDTYAAYDKLKHEAKQLPLAMPLKKVRRITSGFGLRRDPFRRTIAMHAGIDFKGELGSPIYATADGKVVTAGWEGAYGRMVEISHDNGVATRYAHLSLISVTAGQKIRKGDVVGKMGNTGRSTGPHLHYETRVKGRAIDPARIWRTKNAIQRLDQEG